MNERRAQRWRAQWWRAALARHRRRLRRVAAIALTLGLASFVAWVALRLLPLPERLRSEPSTVVRTSDGSAAHVFLAPDGRFRIAARLDQVDAAYLRALVRYEDRRFAWHPGVDPLAIARAAALNLRRGRVASGGSTLTMQLVRVLEPRPRTLGSKLVEAVRALQLETRLSKDEILAAYLTFAPYGRNVEGIEAAALATFGHGATHLSGAEIATLLAVPQRPGARWPCAANGPRLRAARDGIAERLLAAGVLPDGERGLDAVRRAPVPTQLAPLPRGMPHAATWLRERHPGRFELLTTIEREAQAVAESQLAKARPELTAQGIHDGALVVVDPPTGNVIALVGNFDFFDARPGSQLIAFDVPRSPGSALKPFVHGLAIDAGLVLPDTLVADVPVAHGSYAPDNYTGTFTGLVSLRAALSWSLNVPFVDLLARVGVERFVSALRNAGVQSLPAQPGRLGLSAAVGGVELTPLEVAALYAALADGGRARPVRLLADDPVSPPRRFLSPGAAWLTRDVLRVRDRPDFPLRRQFAAAPAHVFWKTGTSQGHLDAWACGAGPRHAAIVWLGNLDRTPAVGLVGSDAAAPILFDVLEALHEPGRWPATDPPPPDLANVQVCSYSGHVPGPACTATRSVRAVRASVPTAPCPYHVAVDVDLDTGLALPPSCRAGHRTERRTFTTWPATVRRYLSATERTVPQPPTLAAGCEPVAQGRAPSVVSPAAGHLLVLMPGVDVEDQQVALLAESSAPGARHAWFVDGAYLGTLAPEEPAWWTPSPGRHSLVVVDDAGRAGRRTLDVRTRGR